MVPVSGNFCVQQMCINHLFTRVKQTALMCRENKGIFIWKSSFVFDQRTFHFYLNSFLYSLQPRSVQKAAISSESLLRHSSYWNLSNQQLLHSSCWRVTLPVLWGGVMPPHVYTARFLHNCCQGVHSLPTSILHLPVEKRLLAFLCLLCSNVIHLPPFKEGLQNVPDLALGGLLIP